MPDEISDLSYDLCYNGALIADSNSRREVKTAEVNGEYRMRFVPIDGAQVHIDVRIRRTDSFTRLHFYEPASQTLSASSRQLLGTSINDLAHIDWRGQHGDSPISLR